MTGCGCDARALAAAADHTPQKAPEPAPEFSHGRRSELRSGRFAALPGGAGMAVAGGEEALVTLYRVQNFEGRGPFQRGITLRWLRPEPDESLLTIMEECGDSLDRAIIRAKRNGLHLGCACDAESLALWFNPDERRALGFLGFGVVDASRCEVLLRGRRQVVVGWPLRLAMLPRVPWP